MFQASNRGVVLEQTDIEDLLDAYKIAETYKANWEKLLEDLRRPRETLQGKITSAIQNKIFKRAAKEGKVDRIVDALNAADPAGAGFLTAATIKGCFHEGGLALSTRQVAQVLQNIRTNTLGEFDYRELAELVFD